MSATTPTVAADLVARITALAAADFPAVRMVDGPERQPDGITAENSTSVRFVDELPDDYDATGSIRVHTFQVKRRFDTSQDARGMLALAAMVRLHDLANKTGAWTGASGAVYIDLMVRPGAFPRVLEENYVVMDLQVWFDTLSSP